MYGGKEEVETHHHAKYGIFNFRAFNFSFYLRVSDIFAIYSRIFFFCFFFFCFSIRSLRNIRSQLFFSRFLLFPAFCTSFSLPPFILATIFCSSTRGRSFILPSSCLLDGTSPHPLSLFSQTLSLYVFRRFHSNLYTFADSFSRCILAFHPFCHSYPFSYFSLLLYFPPF